MNIKKTLIAIALIITTLAGCLVTVNAAEANDSVAVPCYDNVNSANFGFTISSSGAAKVTIKYEGIPSDFYRADVTVTLQRKTLGLFWTDVDGGEWYDYSYNVKDSFVFETALSKTGTYRAKITLEVRNGIGRIETIEQTLEYKY